MRPHLNVIFTQMVGTTGAFVSFHAEICRAIAYAMHILFCCELTVHVRILLESCCLLRFENILIPTDQELQLTSSRLFGLGKGWLPWKSASCWVLRLPFAPLVSAVGEPCFCISLLDNSGYHYVLFPFLWAFLLIKQSESLALCGC